MLSRQTAILEGVLICGLLMCLLCFWHFAKMKSRIPISAYNRMEVVGNIMFGWRCMLPKSWEDVWTREGMLSSVADMKVSRTNRRHMVLMEWCLHYALIEHSKLKDSGTIVPLKFEVLVQGNIVPVGGEGRLGYMNHLVIASELLTMTLER